VFLAKPILGAAKLIRLMAGSSRVSVNVMQNSTLTQKNEVDAIASMTGSAVYVLVYHFDFFNGVIANSPQAYAITVSGGPFAANSTRTVTRYVINAKVGNLQYLSDSSIVPTEALCEAASGTSTVKVGAQGQIFLPLATCGVSSATYGASGVDLWVVT
jgi:hypothetical protein